jgi:hypothetical protein
MLFKAMLIAFALSEGADVKTTVDSLGRGCYEANPLIGSARPSIGRLIAIKVPASIFVGGTAVKLHKNHKKAAIGVLASITAMNGTVAWLNTRCRQ